MGDTYTLGIVDNDHFVLPATKQFVSTRLENWTIRWCVDSGQKALHYCQSLSLRPDALLIDASMPDMDGITLTHDIRVRDNSTVIIVVTANPLSWYASSAARAGAQALVSKGKPEEIARALQAAQSRTSNFEYEGIPFETPANAFLRLSRYKASGLDALSNRENEIIDLCRHGKTSKDIADYLGVTTSTVETHLRRASEKVGAHNRMELVAIWLEHRIKR